jgi:hypothetical protein
MAFRSDLVENPELSKVAAGSDLGIPCSNQKR